MGASFHILFFVLITINPAVGPLLSAMSLSYSLGIECIISGGSSGGGSGGGSGGVGRAEVLRGLRNFLSTDKPEHHSIDRLKERGVEKESGRHSTLQGRELSVFNQTNIGTVSRATLGRLLRDGAERVWAFPSATMPS